MLGFIHIPEICFHPPDVLHEYGNMEMYTHRINWFLPYPHSLQNRARIAQIQQLYFCTQGSYLPSLCTPVAYTTKRESNYQNQPSVERFQCAVVKVKVLDCRTAWPSAVQQLPDGSFLIRAPTTAGVKSSKIYNTHKLQQKNNSKTQETKCSIGRNVVAH